MSAGPWFTTLVSTDQLNAHLQDPGWIIFDCRFDLKDPGWGLEHYCQAHIPGAIYAHLNDELSGPVQAQTGRHPLPTPEHWIETLSNWGVNAGKQVVVYDTTGGSFAARMWWMLRWIGHTRVAVLDGGFQAWKNEARPINVGVDIGKPSSYYGRQQRKMVASIAEVEKIRQDPAFVLIDARASARFNGEEETIDPIAGHIPGAVNRFHGENLGPDGKFLPAAKLNEAFSRLLGNLPAQKAVVYCGSGVTSCHHLLAMEIAGLPGARLYPGSWSEWIRDAHRPIAAASKSIDTGIIEG